AFDHPKVVRRRLSLRPRSEQDLAIPFHYFLRSSFELNASIWSIEMSPGKSIARRGLSWRASENLANHENGSSLLDHVIPGFLARNGVARWLTGNTSQVESLGSRPQRPVHQ